MENKKKEQAEIFGAWTSGWVNIFKIIALCTAAIWTLYQWNISIFPKESFEDFARKAARRTDLQMELSVDTFDYIDELFNPSQNAEYKNLFIAGKITVKNNKDFPIVLDVKKFNVRFGKLQEIEPTSTSQATAVGLNNINWFSEVEIPINKAFEATSDIDVSIIEPNGSASLPFSTIIQVNWQSQELSRFFSLTINSSIKALDPGTGDIIEDSMKPKGTYYLRIITNPLSNSDKPLKPPLPLGGFQG